MQRGEKAKSVITRVESFETKRAVAFAARDVHRSPPHSIEAEQGVLGSMFISPRDTIGECVEKINEEYFYVPAHQTIYNVLVELWNAGQAIDLITFTQVLRDRNLLEGVGGAAFVTGLFTFVPTAANVQYYIDILRDKYVLRSIIAAATESVRRAYESQADVPETLAFVTQKIDAINCNGSNGQLPSIEDGAELISKPIITPDFVIEDVLARGEKGILAGASKAFKTWMLTDAAASVATGRPWLGKFPTRRGPALFINLEIQRAYFSKRLKAVCDESQITIEDGYLRVWNLRGYACDLSILLPRLLRGIGRDQYVLIIIDPIYKVLGTRVENDAGDIATLMNEIDALAVKTGAVVLFGAHYSKGNQAAKEAIDRVGGSGVFARDPDTILNFTSHEQADCFTVDATLRNHPPIQPFVVRWEYPLMVVDETLDPARLKVHGAALRKYAAADVAELLQKPMTAAQLKARAMEDLAISPSTFDRRFRELKKDGTVTKVGKKWRLT